MQNDTDEFVFIRKRKRLRTLDARETEAVGTLEQASDPRLHSGLIPEITALPEPATSSPASPKKLEHTSPKASSDNIVTVEKFLRRGVQTAPRTKQAGPGSVSLRKSRAYTHRRPAERGTTRDRKATKVPKRSRESSRIANALFRAAILTDVDPLDTLVDDAGISHSRRPLKFVPLNKFTSPVESGPTKPIEPSQLGRGESKDPVSHTRRHGHTSGPKQHHHAPHARVPLPLVPLQEAEAAYSVIFP
ncbi:hypothetical protein L210DRAFT_3536761 [Boletus edulis BED1]|uniref:Uncharacterized protein n=1 Tax=Boletus edulis BED1 TaxID=1328754 RepID=A0AAD4GGA7_BOLED|nr:hypothetical protein L210DRAFT_3536761 [Boletus edulis BED1]